MTVLDTGGKTYSLMRKVQSLVLILLLFNPGPCNSSDVCSSGVCLANGWSCSVVGSFGHNPSTHEPLYADKEGTYHSEHNSLPCTCLLLGFSLTVFLVAGAFLLFVRIFPFRRQPRKPTKKPSKFFTTAHQRSMLSTEIGGLISLVEVCFVMSR